MKWVMRAIQAVTLAVLMAGGAVLMAGGAGLGEAAPQNVCYYGSGDCGCAAKRDDAISVANRVRDKRIGSCTDALCIETVFTEHRQRLDQIEANYQLCYSLCQVEYWIRFLF